LARLTPGSRLPIGQELAAEFNVDLVTVKRALSELSNEGLIVRHRRFGTFATEKVVSLRKILWVIGLELADAQSSQYWFDCVEYAKTHLTALGFVVENVWISSKNPEQSLPYMSDERLAEYLGFGFAGCLPSHPLRMKVVDKALPHVITTTIDTPANVKIDWRQGIGLGLSYLSSRGHNQISYFGRINKTSDIPDSMQKEIEIEIVDNFLPLQRQTEIDTEAYRATSRMISENKLPNGIVIRDEVVARGVTRAILEAKDKVPHGIEVVVICGKQEIIPYGMPVTYVTFDTEEGIKEAVRILDDKIKGVETGPSSAICQFKIEEDMDHGGQVKKNSLFVLCAIFTLIINMIMSII
jgi:DNA-binding LacI/PurR family transcriptional regulator